MTIGIRMRNRLTAAGYRLACLLMWLMAAHAGAAATAIAAELPLLLAERYTRGAAVGDYWISEKLDGVRAYWDGRQLRFRSGREIPAPAWFTAALPTQALDGELWLGRGRFDDMAALVRREAPDDDAWQSVRYMIFELPGSPGSFTDRIDRLRAVVAAHPVPWLQMIEQFRLPDEAALQRRLKEVVRAGGEGLMLHRAAAPYTTGRSAVLLKLTPWHDAEARVVAHLPGKGKYAGMLGALRVEMPNGKRFALGSGLTDEQRRHPPPPGTQVTYRYRALTRNGLPRFPHFLRVRDAW